jgi:putative NIF3 family GTP cyclohydrolase 1 type 2
MYLDNFTRRNFMLTGTGLATAELPAPQKRGASLTAAEVVQRIREAVGIPWRTQTVDNIVAGDADTPVTGIATTMMATLSVLERCVAAGKNLVITHETPFYMHQDKTDNLQGDRTYQFKVDFIRKHEMVVFHFHDHWHARHPDGIAVGMMRELDWEKNADPQDPRRFVFSGLPLEHFAKAIELRLQVRTMRVVGDPKLPVRRVFASWGYVSQMPGIPQFAQPDVDVFIAGEAREWELVEYAQDAITMGQKKALILLGHVVSEQGGMQYCAEWLKDFIREVPIEFIAAPEPFWNPDNPKRVD